MNYRASKYSYGPAIGTTDLTVESGEPVTVFGIVVANGGTATTVNFEDKDGNPIVDVTVTASTTEILDYEFVAYNGIVATGGNASTSVTIFHSQPGA